MNIGVFWRSFRNVEFQKMLTPENVKDDAYTEASLHSEALKEAGYSTTLIQWKDDPIELYNDIKEKEIDMVFNASSSEELNFLEVFKIPYTGSHENIVGMSKSGRKIIVGYYNIPTPKFVLAKSPEEIPEINLKYPLFVKPVDGRGSAGIDDTNIIENYEELPSVVRKITEGIGQVALIEEFVKGREMTVGIIGHENPEILPILEIVYNDSKTNTYEHKMFDKETIICPMKLDSEVEKYIKKLSLEIYKILKIKDFGRIDYILDENNIPYFLEVNTFAGLTMLDPHDKERAHYGYMGYMASTKGYSRGEFLGKIVQSTIERYNLNS